MNARIGFSIFCLVLMMTLAGCNLPSSSSTEVVPPDAVFTAAAETLNAELPSDTPTKTQAVEDDAFTVTPTPTVDDKTATFTPEVESTETQTPTATYTVTPTLTPTLPPSPTDIPKIIFFDDFQDETWYTYEDDRYGFWYTDEGYHIYNNIVKGVIWSIREQRYDTVGLEVDVTREAGPDDSYFGVVCNFNDDGENYYLLGIGDDGFYGLALMEDGEMEFLETGQDDQDAIKRGEGKTNRIRGVCNGGHFLLYANGELLLDAWDDSIDDGIVGLAVGNMSGAGTEVRFNDFAITWP